MQAFRIISCCVIILFLYSLPLFEEDHGYERILWPARKLRFRQLGDLSLLMEGGGSCSSSRILRLSDKLYGNSNLYVER